MTTSAHNFSGQFKTPPPLIYPDWQLVLSHPLYFIAFGFGFGLSPKAPGTIGTLLAFPLFWLLSHYFQSIELLLLIDIAFVAGIWACGITGKALGIHDHGGMIWDEIVAFMLVLFFTPEGWMWQLSAFLLFRFFDIVKPQPIRHYDAVLHNGFGVMFDDMLAAFYTLLCLAGWKALILFEGYFYNI